MGSIRALRASLRRMFHRCLTKLYWRRLRRIFHGNGIFCSKYCPKFLNNFIYIYLNIWCSCNFLQEKERENNNFLFTLKDIFNNTSLRYKNVHLSQEEIGLNFTNEYLAWKCNDGGTFFATASKIRNVGEISRKSCKINRPFCSFNSNGFRRLKISPSE